MSKYRIPLVIDLARKKASSSLEKYRLPFRKDEPVEQREFRLTNIKREGGLMVTSQVKLPQINNFGDYSRPSKLEITPVSSISLPQNSRLDDVNQTASKGKESNRMKSYSHSQREKRQQSATSKQKESSQLDSLKQILHENQKGGISQTKSKAAVPQLDRQLRRQFPTTGKYPDDEGTNAEHSETDFDYKQPRKPQKEFKEKQPLPTIDEKTKKKTEADSDEPLGLNIWDSLSKDIAEYREAQRRQQLHKRPIAKRKLSGSTSKRHKYSNEVGIIEEELKRMNQDSSRQLLRKDLYEDIVVVDQEEQEEAAVLPAIKKDTKRQNQPTNFIEKLKSSLDPTHQKPKKPTQKFPLEFYIHSYTQIRSINPFFRKISQLGGCILLSTGKLSLYQPQKHIYHEGDTLKNLYIIVYGKVFLSNKHKTLKKFALTGESLGEEELFEQQKSYIERLQEGYKTQLYRQDARTLTKCCLLTISVRKYYKMYRELHKMGYKQLFNLIDNLFRINYLNKQAKLHHQSRGRVQTDILVQRRNHNNSFFH